MMSVLDHFKAYVITCAAGGVLPCSYEAFAADEARAYPATEAGIPASVQAGSLGQVQDQGGREGGHLMQGQSPETRMNTGAAPGLVVGANTGALTRIAEKLRRAGAKLPMTVTAELATREGLIASGLSIALCLVETEIESQVAAQAAVPTAPAELPAPVDMQRQQDPVRASTKAQSDAGKLIVVGGKQFNAQALLDLQHDAARYRWLRDKADGMLGVAAPMVASLDETGRVTTLLDGDELDAAVDMAMAAPAEKRQRKTKRVGTNK